MPRVNHAKPRQQGRHGDFRGARGPVFDLEGNAKLLAGQDRYENPLRARLYRGLTLRRLHQKGAGAARAPATAVPR